MVNGHRTLDFKYCPLCPGANCLEVSTGLYMTMVEAVGSGARHIYVEFCIEHSTRMPRSAEDTQAKTGRCECGHTEIPYHTTKTGSCFACTQIGRHCGEYREGVAKA